MEKVIQIANLCEGTCNISNPMSGRIYLAKGISPTLNTCGGVENADVPMDKAKVKLYYALGRSNHGDENDKYGTSRFRAKPYFNTVTAI